MDSISFNGDNSGFQNGVNNGSITFNLNSSGQSDQDESTLLNWLSPINHDARQTDMFDRRYEDTGQWFLQTEVFQRWSKQDQIISKDQRALFCYGTQGAGKTVMSAIAIDELRQHFEEDDTVHIAFFYCNYREEVTFDRILASLLRQLLAGNASELKAVYNKTKKAAPTLDEILSLLETTILRLSKVFIVIDALDESPLSVGFNSSFDRFLSMLERHDLRLLVTSRENPLIANLFKNSPSLRIRALNGDIETFLDGGLRELRFTYGKPDISLKIKSAITKAADGMFLLAKLQLQSLSKAFGIIPPSEQMILEKLATLPSSLEDAFEASLTRIENQASFDAEVAKKVLTWILCAKRPLSPHELQQALTVQPNGALSGNQTCFQRLIISVCAGLVTVDEKSEIIRLDHYEIHKYFAGNCTRLFPNAHVQLTATCLSYLSRPSVKEFFDSINQHKDCLAKLPLYEYSAKNWGYHARKSYDEVKEQVDSFLQTKWPLACSFHVLFADPSFRRNKGRTFGKFSPLHPAAWFGLDKCIHYLLEAGLPCDGRDDNGQTALHWAIRNGQIETVGLLLRKGLSANLADEEGKTSLHLAAAQGDLDLIKVLVDWAADLECVDTNGQTPLLTAVQNKNFRSAQKLQELGASIHSIDHMRRNALHYSVLAGSGGVQFTAFLLSRGITAEICDGKNMTPLHYAVWKGHVETAETLLGAGVSVNIGIERKRWIQREVAGRRSHQHEDGQQSHKGTSGGLTPLHIAALMGYSKMVEYLLTKGADPNQRCQDGETPLHLAIRGDILTDYDDAWNDKSYRVEVLIDFFEAESEEVDEARRDVTEARLAVLDSLLTHVNVDVDLPNNQMEAPIHLIARGEGGCIEFFSRLMSKRPEISIGNYKGQTPLHFACQRGNVGIVDGLLSAGASTLVLDHDGHPPLQYTLVSESCSVAVVEMLLDHHDTTRANPCLQTYKWNRNVLHHHAQSSECSERVIGILLNRGANINGIDTNGDSPLSLYLRTDHILKSVSVCQYLLKKGASLLWTDSSGRNLAHVAMFARPWRPVDEFLRTLKGYGVDLTATDQGNMGIAHYGAKYGSLSQGAIDLLREDGSWRLHEQDVHGRTPISYATQAVQSQLRLSFKRFRSELILELLTRSQEEP